MEMLIGGKMPRFVIVIRETEYKLADLPLRYLCVLGEVRGEDMAPGQAQFDGVVVIDRHLGSNFTECSWKSSLVE